MAISFVGANSVSGNTGATGMTVNCPFGSYVAGDLLMMIITQDSNINPVAVAPPGWHILSPFPLTTGDSQQGPYTAPAHAYICWRIATGTEGANGSVTFNSSGWPDGSPYFIVSTMVYRGTDNTNPIERWYYFTRSANTAAQPHPQATTTTSGDWLLSFRWGSSNLFSNMTCSISGAADAERIDTNDGMSELSFAAYDSNAALSPGAQPVRTTTTSAVSDFGSIMVSLVLRPPSTAVAVPEAATANGIGTAYGATAVTEDGPWQVCDPLPSYSFKVDWNGDGDTSDLGDDVTADILDGGVSISIGRDQARQLTPAKTGTASFSLNNTDRVYSPENSAGPLFGDLDPARQMTGSVLFNGTTYPLASMRVDDYNITADFDNRTVDFTFLDGMRDLDGFKLSTGVLRSQRTGDLVNFILDQVGWTGGRDVDPGATIVQWWWVEQVSALQAIQDLVKSEGPPSIAYVALDGTFVFRDRHHRILRAQSLTAQSYYSQNELGDCASPAATGLSFTSPFTYTHGWRDIVNSVTFEAVTRSMAGEYTQVWQNGNDITLSIGQSATITATASDPFVDAQMPTAGTDYTTTGVGTVQITMSRTEGAAITLTLLAVGGSVTVQGLSLRAKAITVASTTTVKRSDTDSIGTHGEQDYGDGAPWAGPEDAYAVAGMILLYYAKRRPTVQIRLTASDPRHLWEILNRTISDRIHITYGELGLDSDFFIESITHSIVRMNVLNQPPVHAVVFGCEKETELSTNPFRFDVRGSGFDQGQFDPLSGDDPSSVFVWDDPRGAFDAGVFGT